MIVETRSACRRFEVLSAPQTDVATGAAVSRACPEPFLHEVERDAGARRRHPETALEARRGPVRLVADFKGRAPVELTGLGEIKHPQEGPRSSRASRSRQTERNVARVRLAHPSAVSWSGRMSCRSELDCVWRQAAHVNDLCGIHRPELSRLRF